MRNVVSDCKLVSPKVYNVMPREERQQPDRYTRGLVRGFPVSFPNIGGGTQRSILSRLVPAPISCLRLYPRRQVPVPVKWSDTRSE